MERTATNVASPPIVGGDLPSFDELLAKGSFHARLARARAEREQALARSGEASGDEFILNTGRKPWEKGANPAPKRDRMAEALSQSVAVVPLVERQARAPAPAKPVPTPAPIPAIAPAAKPAIAPTARVGQPAERLKPPQPVERLVLVAAKPVRKPVYVVAGFGAGLLIGAATALFGPMLRDVGTGSVPVAPETVASVSTAQAPVAGMTQPDPAVLSTVVTPVPVPAQRPLLVVAARPAEPQAADVAPRGAQNGPLLASSVPVALASPATAIQPLPSGPADAGPVILPRPTATPVGMPVPADLLPTDSALPPELPNIGAGTTDLAAVAPADPAILTAAAIAGWAAPAPGRLTLPRVTEGDAPLSRQPLPAAYSAPEPAEPSPPAAPLFSGSVVLHAPAGVADATLVETVDKLVAVGVPVGEPSRVGFTISESNVRYFHAADAEAAAAIATEVGARLRDFTSFDPAPPAGTIEVWLAGKGGAASAPARKSTKRTRSTGNPQLLNLRNRILQQLRNGDHL
ncbi:MAG: hypothetical protein B7Z02_12395 [Rhodobacterales bacterium 32-67-9]|nr:MAG: hypothetical protein B7Z02_12395 [Rhodobacterales bacterium 32-67-9]